MLLSSDPTERARQKEKLRVLLKTWPVRPGQPLSAPLRMLLYATIGTFTEVAFSAIYPECTPSLLGTASLWSGLMYGVSFRCIELLICRFSPIYGLALRCIILSGLLMASQTGIAYLTAYTFEEFWDDFPYSSMVRTLPLLLVVGLLAERLIIGPALALTWGEVSGGRRDVESRAEASSTEM